MPSAPNGDRQPTVTIPALVFKTTDANKNYNISQLFTAVDPGGYDITWYNFYIQNSSGGAAIVYNGKKVTDGPILNVPSSDLSKVQYFTGAEGASARVSVQASHGFSSYGNWTSQQWVTNTKQPVVNNSSKSFNWSQSNKSIGISSYFSVSDPNGKPIQFYNIWITDATGDNPGYFLYKGTIYFAGTPLKDLPASEISKVTYVIGGAGTTEKVHIQASNGGGEYGNDAVSLWYTDTGAPPRLTGNYPVSQASIDPATDKSVKISFDSNIRASNNRAVFPVLTDSTGKVYAITWEVKANEIYVTPTAGFGNGLQYYLRLPYGFILSAQTGGIWDPAPTIFSSEKSYTFLTTGSNLVWSIDSPSSINAGEGLVFNVIRSGPGVVYNRDVLVRVSSPDNSATAGVDYDAFSQLVGNPAGSTASRVSLATYKKPGTANRKLQISVFNTDGSVKLCADKLIALVEPSLVAPTLTALNAIRPSDSNYSFFDIFSVEDKNYDDTRAKSNIQSAEITKLDQSSKSISLISNGSTLPVGSTLTITNLQNTKFILAKNQNSNSQFRVKVTDNLGATTTSVFNIFTQFWDPNQVKYSQNFLFKAGPNSDSTVSVAGRISFYCDGNPGAVDASKAISLNDGKPIYVYTHGYRDTGISKGPDSTDANSTSQMSAYMYKKIKNKVGDGAHVIVTDWSSLSKPDTTKVNDSPKGMFGLLVVDSIQPDVTCSVTTQVGKLVADMLINKCGATPSQVRLIGHSLGSFVSMAAAAEINAIHKAAGGKELTAELVALDPAYRLGPDPYDLAAETSGIQSPPRLIQGASGGLAQSVSAFTASDAYGYWAWAGDGKEAGSASNAYLVDYTKVNGVIGANDLVNKGIATTLHGGVVSTYADLFSKGMTMPTAIGLSNKKQYNDSGYPDPNGNFNGIVLAQSPIKDNPATRYNMSAIGWLGGYQLATEVFGSNASNNVLFCNNTVWLDLLGNGVGWNNYQSVDASNLKGAFSTAVPLSVSPLRLVGGSGSADKRIINNFVPGERERATIDRLEGSSSSDATDCFWLGYFDGWKTDKITGYHALYSEGTSLLNRMGAQSFSVVTGFNPVSDRIVFPWAKSDLYAAEIKDSSIIGASVFSSNGSNPKGSGVYRKLGDGSSDLLCYLPGVTLAQAQQSFVNGSFVFQQYADLINGSKLPGSTSFTLDPLYDPKLI